MRRFIQDGKHHPLIWSIGIDATDATVIVYESGVLGGKMRQSVDRPGPVGTRSAEVQALDVARRMVQEKTKRHGYREISEEEYQRLQGGTVVRTAKELDWKDPPSSTSFWKCQQQPEPGSRREAKFLSLVQGKDALYTVKRDGLAHPILIDEHGTVRIFTRRMDLCTDWYPYLARAIIKAEFPPKTVLMVELLITSKGKDARPLIQSLSRSLAPRAQELQKNPLMRPVAILLCAPYWAGEPIMETWPVERWMQHCFDEATRRQNEYLEPIQILPGSDFEWSKQYVLRHQHEGLVVYDRTACFGPKVVNFRGTPERPDSVWKWKPIFEDDFVVVFNPSLKKGGGKWGHGARMKLPGAVALFQRDSGGHLIYVCDCGSGFDEEALHQIMTRSGAAEDYAQGGGGICGVARIQFTKRGFVSEGDDSNALEFPVFLEWHPDKTIHEVVEPRLGL